MIEASRRAVDSTPIDHPDLTERLINLGIELEWTEKMEDLDEAIQLSRRAVAVAPNGVSSEFGEVPIYFLHSTLSGPESA
jgi:hypothetical protein